MKTFLTCKYVTVSRLLLFVLLAWGCTVPEDGQQETASDSIPNGSALSFKATAILSNDSAQAGKSFFSGNEIVWYNGTTKEIRFADNYAVAQAIPFAAYQGIQCFLRGNYLLSAAFFSAGDTRIYSRLSFYYSPTENRFYLKDGYPDTSLLPDGQAEQQVRDLNMRAIASQWAEFITQLKLERRYVE